MTAWTCDYIVVGREVGEQGTPHLQGYIELANPAKFSTMHNKLPRAHWETRAKRATAHQAAAYCKKEENLLIERGEITHQGERTDLKRVAELVKEKKTLTEIAESHPVEVIKYHRGIETLISTTMTNRSAEVPPTVIWIWGKTGVGKTRSVHENHDAKDIYIKDGTQWWNGYTQQEAILIDDFDGKWPLRDLLRLLDRYAYQGQYKGGYIPINSPYIYITSDKAPDSYWWGEELEQIKRRVSYTFNFL